jgi:hypothetical protein
LDKDGGEGMRHALPDVELGSQAGLRRQSCVTARVVEQDLICRASDSTGTAHAQLEHAA